MTYQEFWCAKLNMLSSKMDRKKYDFFKYLYNVYVKDKDILKMIDTYDVKRNLNNLDYDDTFIAAIATDESNIMVLSKKLSQTIESRRNLAFQFKNLFNTLNSNQKLIDYSKMIERKNKDLDMDFVLDEMNESLNEFKKAYLKEYDIA